MELDEMFFHALTQEGRLEPALDAGVTVDDFEDEWKQVFQFVLDHYNNPKYGSTVPTARMLERKFSGRKKSFQYSYATVTETFPWLCDELIKRTKFNQIRDEARKISNALETGDVEAARQLFLEGAAAIIPTRNKGSYINLSVDIEKRVQKYQDRKSGVGVTGVPTGIAPIDEQIGGLFKGDWFYILAKSGVGKTWACVEMANAARDFGEPCLLISPEMAEDAITMRHDALHFGLPYRSFRKGKLDQKTEQAWEHKVRQQKELAPLYLGTAKFFGGRAITPLAIRAKVKELGIRGVYVDSVYKVESDNQRLSGWEKHVHVAESFDDMLKSLDIYGVFSNQIKNDVTAEEARMEDQAFGSYHRTATVIAKFHQGQDERMMRKMRVWLLKTREEEMPNDSYLVNWDLHDMDLGRDAQGTGEEIQY